MRAEPSKRTRPLPAGSPPAHALPCGGRAEPCPRTHPRRPGVGGSCTHNSVPTKSSAARAASLPWVRLWLQTCVSVIYCPDTLRKKPPKLWPKPPPLITAASLLSVGQFCGSPTWAPLVSDGLASGIPPSPSRLPRHVHTAATGPEEEADTCARPSTGKASPAVTRLGPQSEQDEITRGHGCGRFREAEASHAVLAGHGGKRHAAATGAQNMTLSALPAQAVKHSLYGKRAWGARRPWRRWEGKGLSKGGQLRREDKPWALRSAQGSAYL